MMINKICYCINTRRILILLLILINNQILHTNTRVLIIMQLFLQRVKVHGKSALLLTGGGTLLYKFGIFEFPTTVQVHAEEKVDPPKYPWSHSGLTESYDHAR